MGSCSRNPFHLVSSAANQYNTVAPRSTRIPRPIGPGRTSCGPLVSVACIVPPYLCGDPRSTKGPGGWETLLLVVGRVRSTRSRGQGGAPAATRGRTTLTPARAVAGSGQQGQGPRVSASGPPPGRLWAAVGGWHVREGAQPYLGPRTQGPAT